mmetsp:Transcript_5675/g.13102  ORF Transcript_5675/g.13102 Transcript_5675/m.13102 type:complete len:105 (+) Transcript_5675:1729-2043(+)
MDKRRRALLNEPTNKQIHITNSGLGLQQSKHARLVQFSPILSGTVPVGRIRVCGQRSIEPFDSGCLSPIATDPTTEETGVFLVHDLADHAPQCCAGPARLLWSL